MTPGENDRQEDIASDLLFGAHAVGIAMGLSRRQVYYAIASGHIPVFRIGTTVCARRSTLARWLSEQEAGVSPPDPGGT